MSKKLDLLNQVGSKARLKDNAEPPQKDYKPEKMIRGLNVEIERFYDDKVSKDQYPTYTAFIRAGIYELAKKHGF